MTDQDWKPVIIKNKKVQMEQEKLNQKVESVQKFDAGKNKQNVEVRSMNKIEEKVNSGDLKPETISIWLKTTIQQERQKKNWTRKELALKSNLAESVIADYENGKGIPKVTEINKISKALGISLSNRHK